MNVSTTYMNCAATKMPRTHQRRGLIWFAALLSMVDLHEFIVAAWCASHGGASITSGVGGICVRNRERALGRARCVAGKTLDDLRGGCIGRKEQLECELR